MESSGAYSDIAWNALLCSVLKKGAVIGFSVHHPNGRKIGEIRDIIDTGYQQLLDVCEELDVNILDHELSCLATAAPATPSTAPRAPSVPHGAPTADGNPDAASWRTETHVVSHKIPLVREFVRCVDEETRRVVVRLPKGLTNLAREQMYQEILRDKLEPYIEQPANYLRAKVYGQRSMPTRASLIRAGRPDLASIVHLAGGFPKVAQELGCRPFRRPSGYYQDLDILDQELTLFIASAWVLMPGHMDPLFRVPGGAVPQDDTRQQRTARPRNKPRPPVRPDSGAAGSAPLGDAHMASAASDSGEDLRPDGVDASLDALDNVYFYNRVLDQGQIEEPQLPELTEEPDGLMMVEDESQRYMPPPKAVLEARRFDLHHAVNMHGGYRAVADLLDRDKSLLPNRLQTNPRVIKQEIRKCQMALGRPKDVMPSRSDFMLTGQDHIVVSITHFGGFHKVASLLGLKTVRQWQNDEEEIVREMAAFITEHVPEDKRDTLPPLSFLKAQGHSRLGHAVRRIGRDKIASRLGLRLVKQGRPRSVWSHLQSSPAIVVR